MKGTQALRNQITAIRDQLQRLRSERDEFKETATPYRVLVEQPKIRPRFDPAETLPEEVWLEVVKEVLTVQENGISHLSVDIALYLTCISSKWRRSIESAAILWTDIILDDTKEDLAMRVSISLMRSGSSPLYVHIGGPMRCWHDIKFILVPCKERIRHIYVRSEDIGYAIRNFLLLIIPQLSGSQLQSIEWTQRNHPELGDGDRLFFHEESKLIRSLPSAPLSKNVFNSPNIRNLCDLTTHEDAKRILDIAGFLSHLRRVTFLEMSYGYEGESTEQADDIQLNKAVLPWISLTYRQCIIGTLTSKLARLPGLLNLELSLPYEYLSETMFHMQDIGSLQRLDIRLWMLPSTEFSPPKIRTPLSNVRELVFRDESQITPQGRNRTLTLVTDAFFSLMPDIETLKIRTNHFHLIYELAFSKGFKRLHILRIESFNCMEYGRDGFSDTIYQLAPNIKELTFLYDFTVPLGRLNGSRLEYVDIC